MVARGASTVLTPEHHSLLLQYFFYLERVKTAEKQKSYRKKTGYLSGEGRSSQQDQSLILLQLYQADIISIYFWSLCLPVLVFQAVASVLE